MTTFERFERSIPGLMDDLAPARTPDYFDDLLRTTASHRQRPAWSFPERWLPVEFTARPLVMRPIPWRPVVILALLVLAAAAGLVAYVGAQPKLPPPFGIATNGVLLFRSPDGSIQSVEPRTGATRTLAPASDGLGEPFASRDGQRVAFVPRTSGAAPIIVASVDGSRRVTLAGEYEDIRSIDWSPDGAHIALIAADRGARSVTVVATDGSGATALPLERRVRNARYLPDGRLAVIAAESPGEMCFAAGEAPLGVDRCALFVVGPDGAGLTAVVGASDFYGLQIDPSPDGTHLLYVEWSAGNEGRLHLVNLATGVDRRIPTNGFPDAYAINRASFSPDGRSILFDLFEEEANHWAIVASTGGPPVRIGPAWDETQARWAPDGRSVLAHYGGNELWLLDPTGSGADSRLDVEVPYLADWQRIGGG